MQDGEESGPLEPNLPDRSSCDSNICKGVTFLFEIEAVFFMY